jgi:glucose 1-dehydrogenase
VGAYPGGGPARFLGAADCASYGAGPIGLLGALLGVQLGLEIHVLDRNQSGPKPELVRALGAVYHSCSVADVGFAPDVVLECTGVGQVISEAISVFGASGVVCLTGVGHGGSLPNVPSADVASSAVLKNNVVIGSVSANKRHWYKAAEALARADRAWLARLITGRERPEDFAKALARGSQHIEAIIQFAEALSPQNSALPLLGLSARSPRVGTRGGPGALQRLPR